MRLARTKKGGWNWHLSGPEWSVLTAIGSMYPLIPPDHPRYTGAAQTGSPPVDPTMLREAYAAHTAELQSRIRGWILSRRASSTRKTVVLRLTDGDIEHWLQVLNDARIGSWIRLGSPDQDATQALELTPENERHLFLMEFCGMVQARLLEALDQPDDNATE